MKTFAKTYYKDNLNISIRIKRDERCPMGARLTIKDMSRNFCQRIVYSWFYNDKNMFSNYRRKMKETEISSNTIDEIIEDIKTNLMFEKVITYVPTNAQIFF